MWKKLCFESCKMYCENGKYLASILDGSTIIYDEVIKSHE